MNSTPSGIDLDAARTCTVVSSFGVNVDGQTSPQAGDVAHIPLSSFQKGRTIMLERNGDSSASSLDLYGTLPTTFDFQERFSKKGMIRFEVPLMSSELTASVDVIASGSAGDDSEVTVAVVLQRNDHDANGWHLDWVRHITLTCPKDD